MPPRSRRSQSSTHWVSPKPCWAGAATILLVVKTKPNPEFSEAVTPALVCLAPNQAVAPDAPPGLTSEQNRVVYGCESLPLGCLFLWESRC